MAVFDPESLKSKAARATLKASLTVAEDYFYALVVAEVPFLGIPVISHFVKFVIGKVMGRIESEGQLFIYFAFVDREMEAKKNEYERAVKELKTAIESNLSEEAQNEAKEKLKKNLANLIRLPVR